MKKRCEICILHDALSLFDAYAAWASSAIINHRLCPDKRKYLALCALLANEPDEVVEVAEVAQHLVVGDVKTIRNGIKDALIGLMQQQPVEAVGSCMCLFEQSRKDRWNFPDGEFVDLLAIHLDRLESTALMAGIRNQWVVVADLRQLQHLAATAI